MNRRWAQVAVSFLIVVAVYQLYARLAVPMIEPEPTAVGVSEQLIAPAEHVLQERMEELIQLFPGRREFLKQAKIFEIDQSTLVFQDYFNLGDGRILVRPCLIIFQQSDSPPGGKQRDLPNTLVLEAIEGAIFQFDRTLDLRSAKVGRFLSGQLLGNIVLRGEGPHRDFRLTTRDVTLTEHRVWTNHPVELLWGRHRARGSGLEIVFQGRTPFSKGTTEVSPFRIQRFLLRHVDRLHIDISTWETPTDRQQRVNSSVAPSEQQENSLEVACQGPLLFIPGQRIMTLQDQVELTRTQSGQTTLRMTCDRLSLLLNLDEIKPAVETAGDEPQGMRPALSAKDPRAIRLKLLQAVGRPVTVTSPIWKGELVCEDLRFDVEQGLLSMDGSQGVSIKRAADQLRAPRIQCQLDPEFKLRTIAAGGPGEVRSQISDTEPLDTSVSWQTGFFWTFQEKERMLAIQGQVRIQAASIGSLECEKVWCWLEEAAEPTSLPSGLRPRRIVAEEGVRIISPQIQADTQRLEAWFIWQNSETTTDEVDQITDGLSLRTEKNQTVGENKSAFSQLQMAARLLRVEFHIINSRAQLSALSADGTVKVQERLREPEAKPLEIYGEHLEIIEASTPQTVFALTGNPAYVAGRGLSLSGFQIFLDRERNLLSTSGPGRVEIHQTTRENNLVLPIPAERVEIQWSQGMDFDGQIAIFKGNASLTSRNRRIQAETLEFEIAPPISLAELNAPSHMQLQSAKAVGQVIIENVEADTNGQVQCRDQLFVSEIAINWTTGAITAPGFGHFLTVRSSAFVPSLSLNPLESKPVSSSASGDTVDANQPTPQPTQPVILEIVYSQGLAGNIYQRTISCRGRVKVKYGAGDRWDLTQLPDDPALLGPRGLMLNSDEIAVYQMMVPGTNKPHLELEARGNVTVEGQSHTARARRLAFDESKTLLTLEGDSDIPAELYRQEFSGGPVQKTAARRIYYWYSTKTIKVDDPKSLEVSRSPLQNSSR
ncbi:MAG: hypothetical protein ACUVQG_05945 [Thermogutta sp.]